MIEDAKKAVHIVATASATAGASPIPFSDAPIIAAIQTKMILSINGYFEVDMENNVATSTAMSILGVTAIANAGKTAVSSVLKLIPGAGSIIGGAQRLPLPKLSVLRIFELWQTTLITIQDMLNFPSIPKIL